jgi:hypothetical protein
LSSDDESDKENKTADDANAGTMTKTALDTLKAETKLQSFINTLTKLDQKLMEDRNARRRDAEEAARSLKRSGSAVSLSDAARRAPNTHAQTSTSSRTQMPPPSSFSLRPLKLTERERKYLETHNGCKKCRRFYLPDGHPCKFPVGDGYVEHTMVSVNEARKCIKLPALPIPRDEQLSSVASVANMSSSSSTFFSPAPAQPMAAPGTMPVAAMMGMSAYPVASVCPPNKSSILGGSDGDLSHDSNDSVSNRIPFFLPHLVWNCAIESHDPSCISRIPIAALIDHGSGPVLIDQELVSRLQLPLRLLHKLFPVSGAFCNGSNSSPQISLMHWVKLKLHDCNNWYSARTVHALVAPSLCHPIILGLPFLHHNNVTVNVCDGTAIDMTSNFDLLHPVAPPVLKPIVKLREIIAAKVAN